MKTDSLIRICRLQKRVLLCSTTVLLFSPMSVIAQEGVVSSSDGNTMISFPYASQRDGVLDYENAIPRTLPNSFVPSNALGSSDSSEEEAGQSQGGAGAGSGRVARVPITKTSPDFVDSSDSDDFSSNEYGTELHPYTTSRVDTDPSKYKTSRMYPYSPTGKLYFKIGSGTYVCSAALIKPGVLVTAAHCVSEFGDSSYFTDFEFFPAKFKGTALTGKWLAASVSVKSSYFKGTESCTVSGIVCPNDVATIKLIGKMGGTYFPGHDVGWYGYSWGTYGFAKTNLGFKGAQITQLGYPVSHDQGLKMQRNDSIGYIDSSLSNNTVIGSRMTGGSSGGPWIVNLGRKATGITVGSGDRFNTVVGVTSWGYVSSGPKQQGASPFTANNIKSLVEKYCPPRSTQKHCVK